MRLYQKFHGAQNMNSPNIVAGVPSSSKRLHFFIAKLFLISFPFLDSVCIDESKKLPAASFYSKTEYCRRDEVENYCCVLLLCLKIVLGF